MKIFRLFFAMGFCVSIALSQQVETLELFRPNSPPVTYFYQYEEFDDWAYNDTTRVFESINSYKTVYTDSIVATGKDSVTYFLTIEEEGLRTIENSQRVIERTNFTETSHARIIKTKESEGAGSYRIRGWIFPDSTYHSTICLYDSGFVAYPYKHVYNLYDVSADDSLEIKNHAVYITVRPYMLNDCLDNFYEEQHVVSAIYGLVEYRRYYWYHAQGFDESYDFVIIDDIDAPAYIPETISLLSNYPNPFNPTTTIRYKLARAGHVTITVYDIRGRKVASLLDGRQNRGEHSVVFDASDLPSGVYFYILRSGALKQSRKMVLLR